MTETNNRDARGIECYLCEIERLMKETKLLLCETERQLKATKDLLKKGDCND